MPGPVNWRGRWGAHRSCSRRCGGSGMPMARGQLPRARELAKEFLELARQRQDPLLLAAGHRMRANTAWWQGELVEAQAHCRQGLAFYDPVQHRQCRDLWPGLRGELRVPGGADPLGAGLSGPGAGHGGDAGAGPAAGAPL